MCHCKHIISSDRTSHDIALLFAVLFSLERKSNNIFFFTDARSCTTCDRVLEELEQIDDDTDSFGVDFVKINDKRLAKQYGISKFPALTYFREKKPIIYEGNILIYKYP
ncbi:hypothetical protein HHI36_013308 [Cryptolaemus montrouzieri]|uniref:Thioredoxin domain-containing protein n=1 Tax=Cryptolaemus montrouzieri TaxID=559131 RepID=A0ABD2NGU3_9CUCU